MRRHLASVGSVGFFIAYVVVLVEFIGFGKRGGWQFALELGILAIGAMGIREWWKKRHETGGA